MLGGPLGAVFGAAFGHNFDQGRERQGGVLPGTAELERIQTVFFTTTFSIMGHIAKADGQVSTAEIRLAEQVMRQMHLNAGQKKVAQRLFSEGKKSGFPFVDVLRQFRQECHHRRTLLQMFMEIQMAVALSDGTLDAAERRILEQAAATLGFSRDEYAAILRRMQAQQHAHSGTRPGMSLADAYKLLGIDKDASEQDVKRAYRRLMNQHHPDKLVAKGLPEEMMAMANKKAQDIKEAYETVKQSRKK